MTLVKRSALLEAAAHGQGRFVVDMTRTHFCDTAGLHGLVAAHKRTRTASLASPVRQLALRAAAACRIEVPGTVGCPLPWCRIAGRAASRHSSGMPLSQ